MANLSVGSWLGASPLLNGSFFEGATIFIYEYNADGAVGVVTNRLFGRNLNELEEFAGVRTTPLLDGGPVDREHLFVLHRRPDLIRNSSLITGHIYFGGDFSEAVKALQEGSLQEKEISIYVGYCGWDAGELEAEIEEGSWKLIEAKPDKLFSAGGY